MALQAGAQAGPYRIVEPLGRGGMASVYRAYEPKLDRYVALKVLPREFLHDPNFAQRFRDEARLVAKLEHPNIIPIYAYDIEEREGIPWMAMRLVPSGSLSDLIKRERLPLARAVAILRGVAEALDYAHRKGVVHRDVKPQNVLLDDAGRVYLADFGIGKMLESSSGLTGTGMIVGTPQYMAPEQAATSKVGPPADIYALGIVTYELFTGRVPFSADTPLAVMMKHVQEPLPLPPPDVVPEPLLRALLKATSKKPEDRWPSAGAFVAALASGLGDPAHAPTEPATLTVHAASLAAPTLVPLETAAPAATARPAGATAPGPTAVATAPPVSGTAPPLPPRPPAMRPPAREAAPAVRGRSPISNAWLAGLVAFGFVCVVGAGAVWLWQWGAGEVLPPETGPNVATGPTAGPAVERAAGAEAPPAPRDVAQGARSSPENASPSALPTAAAAAAVPAPTPATLSAPSRGGSVPTAPAAMPPVTTAPAASPPPGAATTTATTLKATPATLKAAPLPAEPPTDPELERLTGELASSDAGTRRRAAQGLAARGPAAASATPALVAALRDRSPDVRLRAAEALGRIGPAAEGAAPALAAALRDTDALVPAEAAKALGLLGETAAPAAAALGAALQHEDVGVRREAARSLARLGRHGQPALEALVAALSDRDKTVCAQAARALGKIGGPARTAVPRLTALSRDRDVFVSREARAALESIGQDQP